MKRFLVSCVFLLGCNKANQQLDDLADQACACKDAACGKQALNALVEWAKDNKFASGDEKRAEAAGERLGKCLVNTGVEPQLILDAMNGLK